MDVDRVIAAARRAVMCSTGYGSAWEIGPSADGEELHTELREALGITIEEWRASPDR